MKVLNMNLTKPQSSSQLKGTERLKVYLPYVLSSVTILIFATHLWLNIDRYRRLLDFSLLTLLSLIGLALPFTIINGAINYVFYRPFGVFLGVNESIGLAAVNTLANQLPFAGGLVAKSVYLNKRHQLAYTHFLSATMALYVCFIAVNGAVALTVLGYWRLFENTTAPLLIVLGFFGMTASVTFLWLPINIFSWSGKIGDILTQLAEGWCVLSQQVYLISLMMGFQILMILLLAARFWISFHALSQSVTYAQCVLFATATVLTRLVNIAPGGLGVREGIVAGVASLLGFEAGVSAVAVGIDRLVATSVIIVLGTIYTYVLSKKATGAEPADAMDGGE
jgi:uncharacterized membrane protein YbhN (UPF0104 family)